MKKSSIEMMVGLFIIAGVVCLGYLSIEFAGLEFLGRKAYNLQATFSNSGGLKVGSGIIIAGVEIGRVKDITLQDYQAHVVLSVPSDVQIQEDAIASIRTKGLIGEKYVNISPGGSDKIIPPGGKIRDTQPAIDLEEVVSKYVFGKI